jgi:hypothetical protein
MKVGRAWLKVRSGKLPFAPQPPCLFRKIITLAGQNVGLLAPDRFLNCRLSAQKTLYRASRSERLLLRSEEFGFALAHRIRLRELQINRFTETAFRPLRLDARCPGASHEALDLPSSHDHLQSGHQRADELLSPRSLFSIQE